MRDCTMPVDLTRHATMLGQDNSKTETEETMNGIEEDIDQDNLIEE